MLQSKLNKPNANCKVCGKPYYVCQRCIELKYHGTYVWKLDCDSDTCFKLKVALDSYAAGNTDRIEVLDLIAGIKQYTDILNLISPYKEIYEEVVGGEIVNDETDECFYEYPEVIEDGIATKTVMSGTVLTENVEDENVSDTAVAATEKQSNVPYNKKKKHGKHYAK